MDTPDGYGSISPTAACACFAGTTRAARATGATRAARISTTSRTARTAADAGLACTGRAARPACVTGPGTHDGATGTAGATSIARTKREKGAPGAARTSGSPSYAGAARPTSGTCGRRRVAVRSAAQVVDRFLAEARVQQVVDDLDAGGFRRCQRWRSGTRESGVALISACMQADARLAQTLSGPYTVEPGRI